MRFIHTRFTIGFIVRFRFGTSFAVPIPRWHQRKQSTDQSKKHRNETKKKVTTKNGNDDSIRYSLGSARSHIDHPLTRRRRRRRNPSSSGCLFVSHQENEVVVEAESFLLLLLLQRRRFEESGQATDMYGGRAPLCPRVKFRLEARPLALPSFPSGLLKTFNFLKLSKMFTFI